MSATWMPKMIVCRFYVCPAGKASAPVIVNHEISTERARKYREGDRKVVASINDEIARITKNRHQVHVDSSRIIISMLTRLASA